MNISFKPSFVRDFKSLPSEIKTDVRKVCIGIFPNLKNLFDFKEYPVKKISGFSKYYRIKIGDYRIGFKKETNTDICFLRVKHRKDIYKVFP
ncbi:MAG: type II toxin-antitoxin system RelE/ParE family toxin [Candidatus Paceibacterota bacterium]